jgi:hypothetical protein
MRLLLRQISESFHERYAIAPRFPPPRLWIRWPTLPREV